MTIHALVNVYNDAATLPLALENLKDVVDDIIIADGAYQRYYENYLKHDENVKPWSTDGTLEVAKALTTLPPIKIIECPNGQPWVNQTVKRTTLLDAVPQGDWFIVQDADEMWYGDVEDAIQEIMQSGCIVANTPIYNPGLDISQMRPFWHPRVFLKINGMHYARKHWLLCDYANRVIELTYPMHWTDTMVLTHLRVFKNKGRMTPHLGYMHMMSIDGWMEPYEKIMQVG